MSGFYRDGKFIGDSKSMTVTHVNGNRFRCTSESGHEPYQVILTREGEDGSEVWAYCSCPGSYHGQYALCKHGRLVKRFAQEMDHPIYRAANKGPAAYAKLKEVNAELHDELNQSRADNIILKAALFDLLIAAK